MLQIMRANLTGAQRYMNWEIGELGNWEIAPQDEVVD